MRKVSMLAVAVVAVAGLAGCEQKKSEPAKPAGNMVVGTQPGTAPVMGKPAPAAGAVTFKGKVLERVDAATYSYLRLSTAQGETWAAVPQTATQVGTDVEVVGGMQMDGFESKTLGRKFDKIVFGQLGGTGPGATPEQIAAMKAATGTPPLDLGGTAGMGAMPPGHPPVGGAAAAAAVGDVKVDKATGAGAKTVAEVWAEKAKLKDGKVTVKAKVVKASNGIMGKNWLHLRDGSGTDAAKDNDLTVTTSDTAAVGDVVVVEGAVHVDRNFGAGYEYPVILEDASVKKP